MSKKNRVLASVLVLMGAAMLGSCVNSGEASAASAAVALISDCVSSVL